MSKIIISLLLTYIVCNKYFEQLLLVINEQKWSTLNVLRVRSIRIENNAAILSVLSVKLQTVQAPRQSIKAVVCIHVTHLMSYVPNNLLCTPVNQSTCFPKSLFHAHAGCHVSSPTFTCPTLSAKQNLLVVCVQRKSDFQGEY